MAWFVPFFAEGAALGRSIAFAWLIGAEELGQAMILALTLRLVEMASDVGLDRLMIQAPDGDCPDLQAGLHGISLLRGLAGTAILLVLAAPLALLFDSGPAVSSYALLAFVPLLRGFAHLDFRRAERGFRYSRMAVVEGGATLAMLIAILPAVLRLGDHRAMVAVLIAHAAAYALLSHCTAQRRYTVSFDTAVMRRAWVFGAPLVLNAFLLFLTFYADRVIVAQGYNWASLALYGVVLQSALLPAQIVGRAASSLVLPRLRASLASSSLAQVWPSILMAHVLLAAAMGLAFATLAPALIAMVYGEALRPDVLLAACVATAAAFRIVRTPYSQLAIALGRTADPARANLLRAIALGPAVVFAATGLPLAMIGLAGALGEAAATLRAIQLSRNTAPARVAGEVYA
jgi:O-antigen/teichoic acid export membrane protein